MYLQPHDSATCRYCGNDLMWGTKDEANSWKVYYVCDDCGREWMTGRISLSEIDRDIEISERARVLTP